MRMRGGGVHGRVWAVAAVAVPGVQLAHWPSSADVGSPPLGTDITANGFKSHYLATRRLWGGRGGSGAGDERRSGWYPAAEKPLRMPESIGAEGK